MVATELGALLGRNEPTATPDWLQAVLCQEEGVVLPQALSFGLDVG